MIPLQDVVPTRQTPIATLALIAVNIVAFWTDAGEPRTLLAAPVAHTGAAPLVIGLVLLWLFGDNVEAALGRVGILLVYGVGGWLPPLGAAGAITAVMGSYFVLLPRSRILTLVPFPPVLVEVPAAFFLAVWAALHVLRFVTEPRTIWAFGLAFLVGAGAAALLRRPVSW
jgi:membrane associated rhomboid family serine protease